MKWIAKLLLLCALNASALDAKFAWDENSTNDQVLAYFVLERIGTNWLTVAAATNNSLTVSNYDASVPRTFSLVASNYFGVSDMADPVTVPKSAGKPSGLKLIKLSIVVPVPGSVEFSQDLSDWRQSIHVTPDAAGILLSVVIDPTGPMWFMRPRETVSPPYP